MTHWMERTQGCRKRRVGVLIRLTTAKKGWPSKEMNQTFLWNLPKPITKMPRLLSSLSPPSVSYSWGFDS